MSNLTVYWGTIGVDPNNNVTNTTPMDPESDDFLLSGIWNKNPQLHTGISGPTTESSATACILFRGSFLSIAASFYADTSMQWWLDGYPIPLHLRQQTGVVVDPSGVLRVKLLLEAGPVSQSHFDDHQLVFSVDATAEQPVQIEFGIVSRTNNDLPIPHPSMYGMSAVDVPLGNVADDTSPQLTYSSEWSHVPLNDMNKLYWKGSISTTISGGSWVETTFSGAGIWFFGDTGLYDTHLNITVTEYSGSGETVRWMEHSLVGGQQRKWPLLQSLIFNDTSLSWTLARTYRITLLSDSFRDKYKLLRGANSVQGTFVDIPGRDFVTSESNSSNRQAWVAAPIILGTAFLGILVYVLLYVWRKRRRDGYVGKDVDEAPVVSSFHTQSTVPEEVRRDEKCTHGHFDWMKFGSDSHVSLRLESVTELSAFHSSDPSSVFYEREAANLSSEVLTETSESRQGHAQEAIALEDMQLSHQDLALIFQRAKELMNLAEIGKAPEFDDRDGVDRLEMLARNLAGV
ncbi:hypothetical protein PIIN_00808 [Serendipita indica DSM 11827]|uniref:Uncharacterized protein n=1 Tax=Serendipita indica (strain DSM 11827) TaxID=1109443 RepID=G4T6M8_SERID|nr:hypothetical protein PIIN_00808 [Serendipita indica DSM 11827]